MLETVRAFALEELARAGEDTAIRGAHARWTDAFARDADEHVLGLESGLWLSRYEREHDNFRAAMTWAIEQDPGGLGLRVPEAIWRFWEIRGHYTEGRSWLERALDASPDAPAPLRALALEGLGNIRWRQGDLVAAAQALEESVAIRRSLGDKTTLSAALSNLGTVVELQGDFDRAQALQEEAVELARMYNEPLRVATALNNLALAVWNNGNSGRATALLEESVAIKRQAGNRVGMASSLNNLAMLAVEANDLERATEYLHETLAIDREVGSPGGIADSLGNLAAVLEEQGDARAAAAYHVEALELRAKLGDRLSIAYSLDSIAATGGRAGFLEGSARLYGASERIREEIGASLPPTEKSRYDEGLGAVRSALGQSAFDLAWAAGRELPLDDAITEALHIAREVAQTAAVLA